MDAAIVVALHGWAVQSGLSSVVVLLAERGIFLLPLAMLVVWFLPRHTEQERRAILAGCLAAVIAIAVGLVLERVLSRPRPFVELGLAPLFAHAADSSFPSDHTLVGFAFVGVLAWRAPRIGIWLALWSLAIGFARVAAGVHYPSDIIGSAGLGFLIDVPTWRVVSTMSRPRAGGYRRR
jgi:undecaprenyl-diphosphatase